MTNRGSRGVGYWSDFPDTYRMEQIEAIAKWIAVGESGVVVGGSGAGKSNVVGFLTTRHDVVGRYLPGDIDDYAFIHMDVNALPTINTPFFYRAMLLGLQNAARRIDPALLAEIKSASEMLISLEDTLGLHFVLQQALDTLVSRAGKRIVLTIDRFDEALLQLDAYTLNSLRSLRDTPTLKGKLSYIVFTRHPLARLRNPREYDEFHEIMVPNTCWVGPMVDARRSLDRRADGRAAWRHLQRRRRGAAAAVQRQAARVHEGGEHCARYGAAAARRTGAGMAGPHPGFAVDPAQLPGDVGRSDATGTGDADFGGGGRNRSGTGRGRAQTTSSNPTWSCAHRLASGEEALRVFSPIFELFVMRQQMNIASDISLDPQTGALTVNDRVLPTKLTPPEHRLLAFLIEHKGETCAADTLIGRTWPDAERAVGEEPSSEQLAQVVAQLRSKIELDPAKGVLLQQVDGAATGWWMRLRLRASASRIDEDQFQEQVQKIVESDFFRDLETKAREDAPSENRWQLITTPPIPTTLRERRRPSHRCAALRASSSVPEQIGSAVTRHFRGRRSSSSRRSSVPATAGRS